MASCGMDEFLGFVPQRQPESATEKAFDNCKIASLADFNVYLASTETCLTKWHE